MVSVMEEASSSSLSYVFRLMCMVFRLSDRLSSNSQGLPDVRGDRNCKIKVQTTYERQRNTQEKEHFLQGTRVDCG